MSEPQLSEGLKSIEKSSIHLGGRSRAKTKASFLSLLHDAGEDAKCDVCLTRDTEVLTRHHVLRQSIKKDNSLSNLKSLCREDHDIVEGFYNWIISFNTPYSLYKKRKKAETRLSLIGTAGSLVAKNQPLPKKLLRALGLGKYFNKLSASRKSNDIQVLKSKIRKHRESILLEINNFLLNAIDWEYLYANSVEYAKKKRNK